MNCRFQLQIFWAKVNNVTKGRVNSWISNRAGIWTADFQLQYTTYYLPPTTYHLPPTTYHLQPSIYNLPPSPTAYHLPPKTYHLPPKTYHLPPKTYHLPPTTYNLPPTSYYLPPTTYVSINISFIDHWCSQPWSIMYNFLFWPTFKFYNLLNISQLTNKPNIDCKFTRPDHHKVR